MHRSDPKHSMRNPSDSADEARHWSRDHAALVQASDGKDSGRKRRTPGLSHIGAMVLDLLPLTEKARSETSLSQRARDRLDDPKIERCEFLVCAGGLCIPTVGALRVECHRGEHYVIGHATWEHCRSRAHALRRLEVRVRELDPHELASEAIAVGDPDGDESLWSEAP